MLEIDLIENSFQVAAADDDASADYNDNFEMETFLFDYCNCVVGAKALPQLYYSSHL